MAGLTPASGWTALLAGLHRRRHRHRAVNPALASTAISTVAREQAGVASGMNATFRQVGIATGIAGARRDLPAPDRRARAAQRTGTPAASAPRP